MPEILEKCEFPWYTFEKRDGKPENKRGYHGEIFEQ
jgi:hypothetical protein